MKASNIKVVGGSVGLVLFMLGLGFAADPLYDTFCRVTGYGGTTRIAAESARSGAGPGHRGPI